MGAAFLHKCGSIHSINLQPLASVSAARIKFTLFSSFQTCCQVLNHPESWPMLPCQAKITFSCELWHLSVPPEIEKEFRRFFVRHSCVYNILGQSLQYFIGHPFIYNITFCLYIFRPNPDRTTRGTHFNPLFSDSKNFAAGHPPFSTEHLHDCLTQERAIMRILLLLIK